MTNAYERRLLRRKQQARIRQKALNEVAAQNRHLLMVAYEEAHKDLHGIRGTIRYENGWYQLHNQVAVREGQLRQITEVMKAQKHELELSNVD